MHYSGSDGHPKYSSCRLFVVSITGVKHFLKIMKEQDRKRMVFFKVDKINRDYRFNMYLIGMVNSATAGGAGNG